MLAFKLYWNLEWPIHWRLGGAEGISYARDVTNLEQRNMDKNGYRESNLMNYLDVSLDLNLGDLFNTNAIRDLWFGYSPHHRSSIFETSSAFGRIRGGRATTIRCICSTAGRHERPVWVMGSGL